jgi:hypothetical protein
MVGEVVMTYNRYCPAFCLEQWFLAEVLRGSVKRASRVFAHSRS